ncbi:glycosyl hydrolase family 8 [Novosphingobium resinovorum]|uniref:cellulase n=1 Tax=Novosphingobium resinovorum TaxID=158500 RepID=A0A1D8A623_9SPHN|nr:glycosyl hydrolase family 8 [Novosphingobium resinovorum]AOR77568.1 endoglucanase [Novosphingobium resinovorum]
MAADSIFRPKVDRRTFSLGALMAFTAACNTAPSQGRAQQVNDPLWTQWRDRFVAPEGRVVDTGNGRISHSEGQSYGMILALRAGDREAFERIAKWTQDTLGREDMALHSWKYDPTAAVPVSDPNNATDGDLVIAWALALAGQRWKRSEWSDRAREVRKAIREHCVISRFGRELLLPGVVGFAEGAQVMLNPSYFVWPALDQFAKADGAATWGGVVRDCEAITTLARFGMHSLPSDWVAVSGYNAVAPAVGKPPRFGYDAIRIPLYAAVGGRSTLVQPVADWWRSRIAQHRSIPAWVDVVTGEEANYALSSGGAAIAARLIGSTPPVALDSDYFSASLQMLARL